VRRLENDQQKGDTVGADHVAASRMQMSGLGVKPLQNDSSGELTVVCNEETDPQR
jgi:hypothetical protein